MLKCSSSYLLLIHLRPSLQSVTYDISRSLVRVEQYLPSRFSQIRFDEVPGVVCYKVIRVMIQQLNCILLSMKDFLPNVIFRWYIFVPAVSLYDVFDCAFRFSFVTFCVRYNSGL